MLNTPDKPEPDLSHLPDLAALPIEEFRMRLYYLASDARLILLAAKAINQDEGVPNVDKADADAAYAIERAAERIERRLLALGGGESLDALTRKAVAS